MVTVPAIVYGSASYTMSLVSALLYSGGAIDSVLLVNTGTARDIQQGNLVLNYNAMYEEIRLYDPSFTLVYDPNSPVDADDVRLLGGVLRGQQTSCIAAGAAGACGPNFDQGLYERAVALQDLLELLTMSFRYKL